MRALEGMQGLIRRGPELVLITEFNYQFLGSDSARRFLETLAALGFEMAILDEGTQEIQVIPREEVMKQFLEPETRHVINLLCVRGAALTQQLLGGRRSRSR